jgi:hypothetical protein
MWRSGSLRAMFKFKVTSLCLKRTARPRKVTSAQPSQDPTSVSS